MKIVMIGAGNVATHIAVTLAAKGLPPVQVWSRTAESARQLAEHVGCAATTCLSDVIYDADVYLISVCDSALEETVGRLCVGHSHGIYVHTAGTMPTHLFAGHCRHYGVLYPMQTFSKQKTVDFSTVPCFIDASDTETMNTIRYIAGLMSGNIHEITETDRRWLHIAAVFACNFSNACCAMAARILKDHGLDFNVMLPLVDETICKLHCLSPVQAQTGPAVRRDGNVMKLHAGLLDAYPDMKQIYCMMSEEIIDTADREQSVNKRVKTDDKL